MVDVTDGIAETNRKKAPSVVCRASRHRLLTAGEFKMPWQISLKRKNGTIRSDFLGGNGAPPNPGDIVNYPIDGTIIKAKVIRVSPAIDQGGAPDRIELRPTDVYCHAEED